MSNPIKIIKYCVKNTEKQLQKRFIRCTLTAIVITHWHDDHAGGLGAVLERFGPVPIYKFKRRLDDGGGHNFAAEEDFQVVQVQDHLLTYVDEDDGDDGDDDGPYVLSVEGATLELFHTPGHTTDHLSVRLVEENALFTGDSVLGQASIKLLFKKSNYFFFIKLLFKMWEKY
jgi:glyoxylase-like metal-dependent hydrolase (beta-lactamase superfamily II)